MAHLHLEIPFFYLMIFWHGFRVVGACMKNISLQIIWQLHYYNKLFIANVTFQGGGGEEGRGTGKRGRTTTLYLTLILFRAIIYCFFSIWSYCCHLMVRVGAKPFAKCNKNLNHSIDKKEGVFGVLYQQMGFLNKRL